jgi:transposase
MERRRYTREYKLEAVKLVLERDVSVSQAARELGLVRTVLDGWVRAARQDKENAFAGHGQLKPEDAEISRLRREILKLKAERDILKKAAAYFAKENM